MAINYVYVETDSRDVKPQGRGWEYWSDVIIKSESGEVVERKAVWRRDADIYGYPEDEEIQQ